MKSFQHYKPPNYGQYTQGVPVQKMQQSQKRKHTEIKVTQTQPIQSIPLQKLQRAPSMISHNLLEQSYMSYFNSSNSYYSPPLCYYPTAFPMYFNSAPAPDMRNFKQQPPQTFPINLTYSAQNFTKPPVTSAVHTNQPAPVEDSRPPAKDLKNMKDVWRGNSLDVWMAETRLDKYWEETGSLQEPFRSPPDSLNSDNNIWPI
jgi:hypothetical protein